MLLQSRMMSVYLKIKILLSFSYIQKIFNHANETKLRCFFLIINKIMFKFLTGKTLLEIDFGEICFNTIFTSYTYITYIHINDPQELMAIIGDNPKLSC